MNPHRLCFATLALSIALTGCNTESPESYFQKAQKHLAASNTHAATIELKNALQQDPELATARIALGQIHLDNGDLLNADKEFRLALTAGGDTNVITPSLAHTLLLQGKYKEAIELAEKSVFTKGKAITDTYALAAIASILMDDTTNAHRLLGSAEKIAIETPFLLLSKAYIAAVEGNKDQALKYASLAQSADIKSPLALALEGRLHASKGDLKKAIITLQALVEKYPSHHQHKIFLVQLLIKNQQKDEAEKIVDQLLAINSNHPTVNHLKASLRIDKGDFKAAFNHAEVTLVTSPNNQAAKLIAGITAYQLGKTELSYKYLLPLENELTNDSPATRALIDLKIRLGDDEHLSGLLSKLNPRSEQDLFLLQQATNKMIASGRIDEALELALQLSQKTPDDSAAQQLLGQIKLASGDLTGLALLENALKKSPSLTSARFSLAQQYLREGRDNDAMLLANEWVDLNPDQPHGHVLRGQINAFQNNTEQAKKDFKAALVIAPENPGALVGLSDLLLKDLKLKEAAEALIKALESDLANSEIHKKILELAVQIGTTETTPNDLLITKVQKIQKESIYTHKDTLNILLAGLYIANKQLEKAIDIFKILPKNTLSARHFLILGDIYLHQREYQKAEDTYSQALIMHPEYKPLILRKIGLLEFRNKLDDALSIAMKGLEKTPKDPQLTVASANLWYLKKEFTKASELLKTAPQLELNKIPLYWKLKGLLAMAEANYPEGINAFETYQRIVNSIDSTILLASAYDTAGDTATAINKLKQADNLPHSMEAQLLLASLSIKANNDEAEIIYRDILKKQAKNLVALNNLASIMIYKNELVEGLSLAQRAYAIAPTHPGILDTYGYAKLLIGDIPHATSLLEQAHNASPENLDIRINYALALHRAGKTPLALSKIEGLESQDLTNEQQNKLLTITR